MRILVAPDKFKGSLAAAAVAANIAAGLREALPTAEVVERAIADGGEGTAAVICAARRGHWHRCNVHDAIGNPVVANYCTVHGGGIAILEMAEASGLARIPQDQRDPLTASSFGTGEMLLAAANAGVQQIIIGLGGSATIDGGYGTARALGFSFLDADDRPLGHNVADLLQLVRIHCPPRLRLPPVVTAADVRNPLLGGRGATRVFGPQKGVTADQIELVETALQQLADVVARDLGIDARTTPGAGAA
ncbi:MAG: glycerate kinase, partial [Verrucomicrobiota bacterium]|nr:glycerate kinase [Verrucomicrobiota bacterium]